MRQQKRQAPSKEKRALSRSATARLPEGLCSQPSQAAVLQPQFIAWLRMQSDRPGERGMPADIARATGLSPGYVSRLLSKQRKGELRLPTLQRVARHRGWALWQLFWCIENGVADFPRDPLRRATRRD